MLISHKWLQKYLPDLGEQSYNEVAQELTKSLAEVEQVIPIHQNLHNIVVGEVIRVEKHQNSDHLSVCQVTTDGSNKLQIVCGAPNVVKNAKVAVCLPGGKVYTKNTLDTVEITTTTIRGVESSGMLCSPQELGIGDDHSGILILENNISLGTDLAEILKDYVYEIENKSISHRSDCFSHKGIAREVSAVLSLKFFNNEENLSSMISIDDGKSIDIEINVNNTLLKRFSALLINNIEVKPSPFWMQARLNAVGERSINNIVDITNYIMLDQGQPLHAYDYDKLDKNKLIIRKARTSEEITTLDGKTRHLNKEIVVIADASSIEDIAGIMGGYKSQITQKTTSIILEAATWDMYNIRKTSRELGHRTEASTRFEKGLDPNITLPVLQSAFTLISDLAGGELGANPFDYYPEPEISKRIELDINLVNRMLTLGLTKYEIVEILDKLYITETESEGGGSNPNNELQSVVSFDIPTFRRDINIKEDLVEEVARIYGFGNLTPKIPVSEILIPKSYQPSKLFRIITNNLATLGFDEIKSYSFIGEDDYQKSRLNINDCIKITNPIAPDLKYVRNSLLPSLLKTTSRNQPKYLNFNLFEISRVVKKDTNKDGIHLQPWTLGLLMSSNETTTSPFEAIKGIIENTSQRLNLTLEYIKGKDNTPNSTVYHPHKYANILLNGDNIGSIGVLHPEVVFNYRLKGQIALLEINLENIIPLVDNFSSYTPLSIYPEITRDLSFWIPLDIQYRDIEEFIKKLDISLLTTTIVKDIYTDKTNNKKSITFTLTFQSKEKTLTDTEVSKLIQFIAGELETKLKLTIRG